MKKYPLIIMVSVLCWGSLAQAGGLPALYAGVSAGASNSDANTGSLITNPARCSVAGAACSADDSGTGWKIYAGYPLTNKLAVEAEYADLGKVLDGTVVQGGTNDAYSQKVTGVGLSLLGKVQPLAGKPLSLYGKAGAFHWIDKTDGSFSPAVTGIGTSVSRKESGTAPVLGVGVEYRVAPNWSVRAGWDRYFNVGESSVMLDEGTSTWRTLKTDVDFYSVGAVFQF